jgi:myo-inositol-1(or 4)-monophosphatase
MNLESLCYKVVEVARKAGTFIGNERKTFGQTHVVEKGQRNLVSYVDFTAEKMIVEGLKVLLPEAGFLTEENTTEEGNKSLRWIIDPLDGTTNFIHGLPVFSVSIALEENGHILIGVVHEVNLNESFYAWKDGGAFMNEKRILVSETDVLRNALCATGFPYDPFPSVERYFDTLKFLFQNSRGIRRLGSAAVDLVYVASGRLDAFYEYNLNSWDVAAGALIVKEAGGTITDFSGGENFLFGREIVATNKNIYQMFLEVVTNPPSPK